MKVTLTIADRINLLNIIPTQGDFLTLESLQKSRKKIAFTEEEIEMYKIRTVNKIDGRSTVEWNTKEEYTITIDIGEVTINEIKRILKKHNDEKTLDVNFLSLYKIFVDQSAIKKRKK